MVSFGTLTLIVLAGLAGPLLSGPTRFPIPVVVGEIAAGIAVGSNGLRWIDPNEATITFLGDVGFAMLMLAAGMHVPIRTPNLARRLPRIAATVAVAALLAVPAGFLAAWVSGGEHALIYALLLSGGSAAIVIPVLHEAGVLHRPQLLDIVLQVALADLIAIVAVPLVLEPSRALRIALASLAVTAGAVVVYGVARALDGRREIALLRGLSADRGWALDLRMALIALFALCWLAVELGTSILTAGLSAGLVVSALGGPQRLSTQVIGIAQGFFVPLFFVVLGARIDLGALFARPSLLGLVAVLVVANVVTHVTASRLTGRPSAEGLLATAQLGLPAAIATLGLSTGTLDAGRAAAIVAAGLCSLPIAALGARMKRRRFGHPPRRPSGSLPGVGPGLQ